jgi:hypothetical protein
MTDFGPAQTVQIRLDQTSRFGVYGDQPSGTHPRGRHDVADALSDKVR